MSDTFLCVSLPGVLYTVSRSRTRMYNHLQGACGCDGGSLPQPGVWRVGRVRSKGWGCGGGAAGKWAAIPHSPQRAVPLVRLEGRGQPMRSAQR